MIVKRRLAIHSDNGEIQEVATVDATQPMTEEECEMVAAALEQMAPTARLASARQRLAELVGLPEYAAAATEVEQFAALCNPATLDDAKKADHALTRFGLLYQGAMRRKFAKEAKPALERDARRQAGTRKERHPEINKWIKDAIKRAPDASHRQLWADAEKQRQPWLREERIQFERFSKRVTVVRKKISANPKSDASK